MKPILASLMLLNVACSNIDNTSVITNYKPYEMPIAELPIEIHRAIPNKEWEALQWDQLSSDYYSDGDV